MNKPISAAVLHSARPASLTPQPPRARPLMRRVEVMHLSPDGAVLELVRIVPAIPAFDEAFAALARGTILQTATGPVAIEDLLPGDRVRTADGSHQTLLWRGSTMIVPRAERQDPQMGRLTRIAADALGLGRPMPDLVLGPCARLVHRGPAVLALTGQRAAFIPARDFVDGVNIIDLAPISPVQVFHLAFGAQQRIAANGVEVESHHPGPAHALGLTPEMMALYLSVFPHVADLGGFGPAALPRLRRSDLDIFDAA